jgi:hypothetical protein
MTTSAMAMVRVQSGWCRPLFARHHPLWTLTIAMALVVIGLAILAAGVPAVGLALVLLFAISTMRAPTWAGPISAP